MKSLFRLSITLSFLFSFLSTTTFATVGHEDLDEIRELTNSGQYELALEKHICFHEESKSSSGMAGVRLSYAINDWLILSEKYPPALRKLKEILDKDRAEILHNGGKFQNFHDFTSINKKLNQEHLNLELFLIVHQKYPKKSKRYYPLVEELLMKNKMFEMCSLYITDPIEKFNKLKENHELMYEFAKNNERLNNPIFLEFADNICLKKVMNIITILTEVGRSKEANMVKDNATKYFSNDKFNNAIN